MSSYAMNFASFEIPGVGLVDRTTHVVQLHHPDHERVVLVVYRTEIPEDKTLRDLVAARIADEMTRLSGYAILENSDVEWFGRPAIDVACRYRHEGDVVYLRQAHVQLGSAWVAFALSGPLASRPAVDAWLEAVMTSLRVPTDPDPDV